MRLAGWAVEPKLLPHLLESYGLFSMWRAFFVRRLEVGGVCPPFSFALEGYTTLDNFEFFSPMYN